MKKIIMLMVLAIVIGVGANETFGQAKVNVRFKSGTTMGYYNGTVRGKSYIDYVMVAKAGQTLRVQLQKRSGTEAYFNVLRKGSEVAISDDAREAQSWKGELPANGTYVVRVYVAKADRLANRSAGFKVGFSIEVE